MLVLVLVLLVVLVLVLVELVVLVLLVVLVDVDVDVEVAVVGFVGGATVEMQELHKTGQTDLIRSLIVKTRESHR